MTLSVEKTKRMYINRDKFLSKTFNGGHFKLKYDYTDNKTLNKIESLLEAQSSCSKELIDLETSKPFYEYFFEIFDELNSDKIFNLMSAYYFKTDMEKDKDRNIEDVSSRITIDNDNQFNFKVFMPDQEQTAMFDASYIHELVHFPQLMRKRNYEYMEYSEALSMYFEYLMYDKISKGKGKKIFLNNRIKQLYDKKEDVESDLFYAKNNHMLGISRDTFSLTLAEHLSYYESLEYALNLIDYARENDKKKISDLVYRVLFDESSMKKEVENMKIDTSKCSKILKLL